AVHGGALSATVETLRCCAVAVVVLVASRSRLARRANCVGMRILITRDFSRRRYVGFTFSFERTPPEVNQSLGNDRPVRRSFEISGCVAVIRVDAGIDSGRD